MIAVRTSDRVPVAESAPLAQITRYRNFARTLDRVLAGDLALGISFQPIVDLNEGVVSGYEVLARFPEEFNVPPDVTLHRAALLGRGCDLEDMLCRRGLAARERLPENCFLTMNTSPSYLLSPQFLKLLREQTSLAGVVFEVTEQASIENYEAIRERLNIIRSLTGMVAVDDAGAGYASFHHILEMKPNFIKLDRHFVTNCHNDRAKSALIEMMGAAANRLDAWIIAEGVEIVPELEELVRLDVPLAQGYLLAKPDAEMKPLSPEMATIFDDTRKHQDSAAKLTEHLRSCQCFRGVGAAHRAVRASESPLVTVVVDEWERPLVLFQRHTVLGVRTLNSFMRTQLTTHPAQVLERALTRDEAHRFDPIAVIGDAGEFLGVVHVDQLMVSILDTSLLPRRHHVH